MSPNIFASYGEDVEGHEPQPVGRDRLIYTGLHQTSEQIAETAIQEDADAVGLSVLSGAHMTLVPRVLDLLRDQGACDVLVTVGGTMPQADVAALKELGVSEVFTPGTPTDAIVEFIRQSTRTLAA
jgi:methylmalonyl-CoA mutase, C-terminal domain